MLSIPITDHGIALEASWWANDPTGRVPAGNDTGNGVPDRTLQRASCSPQGC